MARNREETTDVQENGVDETTSVLDLGLEDVPDETFVEGEQRLRSIKPAKIHVSKESGKKSIALQLEVIDEPLAALIFHYQAMPDPSDETRVANRKKRDLIAMCEAFGIEYSPLDLNAFDKGEAWANVTITEDPQYGRQMRVQSFIVGA